MMACTSWNVRGLNHRRVLCSSVSSVFGSPGCPGPVLGGPWWRPISWDITPKSWFYHRQLEHLKVGYQIGIPPPIPPPFFRSKKIKVQSIQSAGALVTDHPVGTLVTIQSPKAPTLRPWKLRRSKILWRGVMSSWEIHGNLRIIMEAIMGKSSVKMGIFQPTTFDDTGG